MFEMIPFRNHGNLRRREDFFNNLFDNFFNDDFFPKTMNNGFNVDVRDTENAYLVEADLPGMKKENLDLYYENGYLTISAKREDSIEDKDDENNYVRRERHYGEFKRSFFINDIDEDNIEANFENGVLKLVLPKKNNRNQKRIEIK
ncbi:MULTISPECIES: heat shock protein Hsp18 [Clostridium]|uniref:Small heat shock protein, putative n=1 Tax=Clostridium novyi (strain NT) TaxID=386415 RepID=A0PX96_CLONN|nr:MULTISPECIES: heat shock protein Hsp18 [Clostridium]ABK61385.1 small heat shock protein, putative [Clostridium novyi NT]KEH86901.1 heat-shock protein [Clostridium novyi A str. NCTC 538]KEH89794.1 heat-shock protein [Clostridium novyi A str. BKT29909]KEH95219.1 heat-shock protein [Clostridium botulinum C/D str. It1]